MKRFEKIIASIEQSTLPWWYWALIVFFIATIRNFLEIFSDHFDIRMSAYLHYYSSYAVLGLLLILVLYFFTKLPIQSLFRIVCSGFIILPLPPLLDLLFSWGKGFNMSYMLPGQHDDLLNRYLTFFGSLGEAGITPGMRIEIAVIILVSFLFIRSKTNKISKGILGAISIYTVIFLYCAMPFFIKWFLETFGLKYPTRDDAITRLNFFMLLGIPLLNIVLYLANKKNYKTIIHDARAARMLHFVAMFFLGFLVTDREFQVLKIPDAIFYLCFTVYSIILAWIFSIITNNITDLPIDKISNADRPLSANTIPLKEYKFIAWLSFVLMFVYASVVGFKFLFLLLCFIAGYWLYSMPPLQLKRVTLLSKCVIGFNSLILIMLGYCFSGAPIQQFPSILIFFMLALFPLGVQFIDLKDYEGDKQCGIKTLPVLLGFRTSQWVIGCMMFLGYVLFPLFINQSRLLPGSAALGAWTLYAVTRKNYSEKRVFYPYLLTLLAIFLVAYMDI